MNTVRSNSNPEASRCNECYGSDGPEKHCWFVDKSPTMIRLCKRCKFGKMGKKKFERTFEWKDAPEGPGHRPRPERAPKSKKCVIL